MKSNIKTNEMMFLQPVLKFDGFFSYVCDNKVGFIDQMGHILQQFKCEFPLKEGYSDGIHAADDQCSIWSCSEYSSIIANGHTYIQKFDEILELKGSQLTQICCIPDLPQNDEANFRLKLFQINDELHFVNRKYLFKLGDNNNAIPLCEFSYENIISFCGHNVVYDDVMNKVYKLNDDFSLELVCELDKSISVFCFAQGGVLIVSDVEDKVYYFVDLINYKSVKKTYTKPTKYAQERVSESLVYAQCGLSLPDIDLEQLFGKNFVQQRNAIFEEFRSHQIQQEGFPHEEANKMMKEAVGECKIDQLDWDSQINSQIKNVQNQVKICKNQCKQLDQRLQVVENVNNIQQKQNELQNTELIQQELLKMKMEFQKQFQELKQENEGLKRKNSELESKVEKLTKLVECVGVKQRNDWEI